MTILTSKQQKFQEEVITFLHFEERIRKEGRDKISKRGKGNKKGVENKIFKKTSGTYLGDHCGPQWQSPTEKEIWCATKHFLKCCTTEE